jgi:hypothetical protein
MLDEGIQLVLARAAASEVNTVLLNSYPAPDPPVILLPEIVKFPLVSHS